MVTLITQLRRLILLWFLLSDRFLAGLHPLMFIQILRSLDGMYIKQSNKRVFLSIGSLSLSVIADGALIEKLIFDLLFIVGMLICS